MVLFSSAVRAQEKTLYAVSESILPQVEGTMSCIAEGNDCSEAEVLGLKADAVKGMRDAALLAMSGNVGLMKLTSGQRMALTARLSRLQAQFVHIAMFQTLCNYGIALLSAAKTLWVRGLFDFILMGMIHDLLLALILVPIGSLVILSCFFWWL